MNPSHSNSPPIFCLGDTVTLDSSITANRRLIVVEIRQYGGEAIGPMFDYVLECAPGGPQVRLRSLPDENSKSRIAVLALYDSIPYNEALLAVVTDESVRLTIHDDTDPASTTGDVFWRIYDEMKSHVSSVNIQTSMGITTADIEYWNYSRLTDIEGIETEEFVCVETNKATGWFEIWRGVEVAAEKIATS